MNTERLIAYVQVLLDEYWDFPVIRERLERIESYLIKRFNRGIFS